MTLKQYCTEWYNETSRSNWEGATKPMIMQEYTNSLPMYDELEQARPDYPAEDVADTMLQIIIDDDLLNLAPIAQIGSDDEENGELIILGVNPFGRILASNGDDLMLPMPNDTSHAFRLINASWGSWNTFQWLAEYDEQGNIIPIEA